MNATENLEKMRKHARAMVKWGVVFMSISLVLFFITLFYHYAIVSPSHPSPGSEDLGPLDIAVPVFIEELIFMSGFILLLIGLLRFVLFLISRLKKDENLGKKRTNARARVELGVALVISGIIPLFYYFAIFIPAYQGKERDIPGVIVFALNIISALGELFFVSGFILLLIIGLLSFVLFLIGRLKKRGSR